MRSGYCGAGGVKPQRFRERRNARWQTRESNAGNISAEKFCRRCCERFLFGKCACDSGSKIGAAPSAKRVGRRKVRGCVPAVRKSTQFRCRTIRETGRTPQSARLGSGGAKGARSIAAANQKAYFGRLPIYIAAGSCGTSAGGCERHAANTRREISAFSVHPSYIRAGRSSDDSTEEA